MVKIFKMDRCIIDSIEAVTCETAEKMYRNQVIINNNHPDLYEISTWLNENCEGLIYLKELTHSTLYIYSVMFELESDIVLFKLKFAE